VLEPQPPPDEKPEELVEQPLDRRRPVEAVHFFLHRTIPTSCDCELPAGDQRHHPRRGRPSLAARA
jgi:hypothetical protein